MELNVKGMPLFTFWRAHACPLALASCVPAVSSVSLPSGFHASQVLTNPYETCFSDGEETDVLL